ncbi:fatty acyl-AMP ligase [Tumebacillus flagellatus]|uniref:Uncharacterized protein n=1 Tax=Tumebacillus flagellatus TaxID=1157490 RepID=A0A074LRU2_9BACL|nr:fatty acyl-AMP ligase [Tumebacillus flagellatus]KEO82563.1 hypothetical protein EL26_14345 [Tumebacillus flagellatus]
MFSTVVDALEHWSNTHADLMALTYLGEDGETEEARLTFTELVQRARLIGAALLERGATGQRVLLAYPSGSEYVTAFFGCLYANAIAVPVTSPKITRPDRRFEAILEDSEAKIVLTSSSILHALQAQENRFTQQFGDVQWLDTHDLDTSNLEPCPVPNVNPDTVAFLQYTSGSTSKPKGVIVTHGHIMRHLVIASEAIGVCETTTFVSWLPLFHDMGLIGNVFSPVLNGRHVVLMSPLTFIKRPLRWLKAIDRYKADITAGPNFAYDLCVRKAKPEDLQSLDLSSLRVAVTGAEPVRYDTVRRFDETFAPCGLKATTLCPSYGMAEATLMISGSSYEEGYTSLQVDKRALLENRVQPAAAPDQELVLIGCGRPLNAVTVRIVNPQTRVPCPPNEVGEIWVSGPQVAGGYWNNPLVTEETFQATLPDEPGKVFLRTGDLGFLHEGEVFITGRHKDLIIIRGQNHYPQDIEWTVENAHPFVSTDNTAAFSIEADGEEKLVIVTEVERQYRKHDLAEVVTAIQAAVSERHELQAHAVIICSPGAVPKTTSGKIQRKACQQKFVDMRLSTLHAVIKNRHVPNWGLVESGNDTAN